MEHSDDRAKFTAMSDGTPKDWAIISTHVKAFKTGLSNRILAHLQLLDGDYGGYAVDRLEHSLQTATRAHRDGRDEPYVVMALLHDIGDTLATYNHPEIGAVLLKPFVSEELHWIAKHHGVFQGHYFFHHFGRDRDMREQFRNHPSFDACAEFCAKYDQVSFDPDYDSEPLSFFIPMVERVMTTPIRATYPTARPASNSQPQTA